MFIFRIIECFIYKTLETTRRQKMSKSDLRKAAGIAPNSMTRLRRDEGVTLTVLHKICTTLSVDIGDIMEFLPEEISDQ